jgi:hypothetical protein
MKMYFIQFIFLVGVFSWVHGYQQCKIAPEIKFLNIKQANKGTPFHMNETPTKHGILLPKYSLQHLKIKLDVAKSESEFRIPTESEIRTKQRSAELDQWFREQFPALFPKYINCQTLSWDECVWQDGCSWCKWPTEGCQYTDVSYLLPTEERCVDGGFPYESDSLPECLMNNEWNPAQWLQCY